MHTVPEGIHVFTTCPPSNRVESDYLERAREVARWSDAAGCTGILVYTDNGLVDPWLVSDTIIRATEALSPLVAVQPVYLHPYAVAKMVASFGYFYGRRVYLNMVAGGFTNDLLALGDETPHDRRYDRLREYTSIILGLLSNEGPVTLDGDFYAVKALKMPPPLRDDLRPGVFVSGSSPAGLQTARELGAVAVQYPKPPEEYDIAPGGPALDTGIRIGIIARESAEEAWTIARQRFPEDRKGQLTHKLAMKVSDSHWHQQLSDLGREGAAAENPYWLVPFENYKTFCPYLVGTYETVAAVVARYLTAGFGTFILDVPTEADDLDHANRVFRLALGAPVA